MYVCGPFGISSFFDETLVYHWIAARLGRATGRGGRPFPPSLLVFSLWCCLNAPSRFPAVSFLYPVPELLSPSHTWIGACRWFLLLFFFFLFFFCYFFFFDSFSSSFFFFSTIPFFLSLSPLSCTSWFEMILFPTFYNFLSLPSHAPAGLMWFYFPSDVVTVKKSEKARGR